MIKILNTWKSDTKKKVYFRVKEPVYKNGDWFIYPLSNGTFLYTYKNIVVNNLMGLVSQHIDNLANNQRPDYEEYNMRFLFDEALKNLTIGLFLQI